MNIEKTPDGRFALVQGARRLVLDRSRYEDIFYALPLDSGTLFRLVNDTVLADDPLRATFRAMIAEAGGMDRAMSALQESAKAVEPS